jgi:hypothetical protein
MSSADISGVVGFVLSLFVLEFLVTLSLMTTLPPLKWKIDHPSSGQCGDISVTAQADGPMMMASGPASGRTLGTWWSRRGIKSLLAFGMVLACFGPTHDAGARSLHRAASAKAKHHMVRHDGTHHAVHQPSTKHVVRDESSRVAASLSPTPVSDRVYHALRSAQEKVQADPTLLLAIAWQESRFDPRARNHHSSARGLLQFTSVTWLAAIRDFGARHGLARYAAAISTGHDGELIVSSPRMRRKILALRDDPDLEVIMASEQLNQEKGLLEKDIGRPAVTADLYVLHLLGPTGAKTFLTELARRPEKPSVDVVGRVARPNKGLFVRNGRRLTVAETYQNIQEALARQVDQHASLFAAAG